MKITVLKIAMVLATFPLLYVGYSVYVRHFRMNDDRIASADRASASIRSPLSPDELAHLRRKFPVPLDFGSQEIRIQKREALMGSGLKAAELEAIYGSCIARHIAEVTSEALPSRKTCEEQQKFWRQIAFENGLPSALGRKFEELAPSNRCLEVYRANFWLQRAVDEGLNGEPWVSMLKERKNNEQACEW